MDQNELDRIATEVRRALAAQSTKSVDNDVAQDASIPQTPVRLVTETVVNEAHESGQSTIFIAPKAIITPLAKDALTATGVVLASALPDSKSASTSSSITNRTGRKDLDCVAIGAVPSGAMLETALVTKLRRSNLVPIRVPTPRREAAHLARQVAGAVSGGQASWGVIIDETGLVGVAVANRVTGVVAAMCHDEAAARTARERLGANVLCVASEIVAAPLFEHILSAWVDTPAQCDEDTASVIRELDRCQDAAR